MQDQLIVSSINQIYKILKERPNIVMLSRHLTNFRDVMFLYINGCPCDKKKNLKRANQLYTDMSKVDISVVKKLLTSLNVKKMILRQSGKEFLKWENQ